MLAVCAKHHQLPFFVAGPTTTLDPGTADGGAIPIEERPREELTKLAGVQLAPAGIGVWNPAFDVHPTEGSCRTLSFDASRRPWPVMQEY